MKRFVCIHGHFYQPPRENPWLEAIEVQDSAHPYHDWNERITAECYAPNARARILNGEGCIERIVNNYSRISFNFGPTLLAWLEVSAPAVYRAVLEADRESARRFSGHGSALAQVYNHMIMPLANRRDKITQVVWGIEDFRQRFGRQPDGMWLAETAADLETLQVLAEHGIRFTILSPSQASKTRPAGSRPWNDVSGGRIDPKRPYRVRLRGGKSLVVFFYDGPISRAVAFERLLEKGEVLAHRLLDAFALHHAGGQLVHIATDGETYGHHHRFGEMALAYALQYIESNQLARLTNYAEYLERFPPADEAQIFENSSWSCPHGVERWRSHCGCHAGARQGWNQHWRKPLREALDWLRDRLASGFETHARKVLKDPWAARDAYISVILRRSPEQQEEFLRRHAIRPGDRAARIKALKLLEMQRHALLMFTSCGWFFDELSGLETVQVLQYAGRAIQLAREAAGERDLEEGFLERLSKARSNLPEHGDGRTVFEKFVNPATVTLETVAAHYAVSAMFPDGQPTRAHCYAVRTEDQRLLRAGKTRLSLGRLHIRSNITGESERFTFGILHLGDHFLSGGTHKFRNENVYTELVARLSEVFHEGDFPQLLRLVDREFASSRHTLRLLFRDEQRRILNLILEDALAEAETLYRRFYENHAPLMRFVTSLQMPLPKRFHVAADFALNSDLLHTIEAEAADPLRIGMLIEESRRAGVVLESEPVEFAMRHMLERLAARFAAEPCCPQNLSRFAAAVKLAGALPFAVDTWQVQNDFYSVVQTHYPAMSRQAAAGDEPARLWVDEFRELGRRLSVRVD